MNDLIKNSHEIIQSDLLEIINNSLSDLLELRDSRIFITGGTGYIGRWILESFLCANTVHNLNISAVVLTRSQKKFLNQCPHLGNIPFFSFVEGDIRDFKINDGNFTHVIHAATDVIAKNSQIDIFDVTTRGTRRVLDFCKINRINNILLLSSGAVYGKKQNNNKLFNENLHGSVDIFDLDSAYGLGKIVTEWLGVFYGSNYGMKCNSARIFAQIGPYLELDAQFAAGNFIRDALLGREIEIKGDGTSSRSYMYPTDLVSWLLAILVRGKKNQVYNVGSDKSVSIKELAETISNAAIGHSDKIKILGQVTNSAASNFYIPCILRANEDLNLTITVKFEEAIRRTVEWYRPKFSSNQDL